MSVDTLMNNPLVTQVLAEYEKQILASEVLDFVELRVDGVNCRVECRFEMRPGGPSDCLWFCAEVFAYNKDFVESFRAKSNHERFKMKEALTALINDIGDDLNQRVSEWSSDCKTAMEDYYGPCLLLDGKKIA